MRPRSLRILPFPCSRGRRVVHRGGRVIPIPIANVFRQETLNGFYDDRLSNEIIAQVGHQFDGQASNVGRATTKAQSVCTFWSLLRPRGLHPLH